MAGPRHNHEDICVFWDYETTKWTSAISNVSNYTIVKNMRDALKQFGGIKTMRTYADFSADALPRSTTIRSELSSSGVTLVDCPGDGRKDLHAKIMIGDRDLAYAVSILRTRGYRVVLITPSTTHADITSQATVHLDWTRVILGLGDGVLDEDSLTGNASSEPKESSSSHQPRQKPSSSWDTFNMGQNSTTGFRNEGKGTTSVAFEPRRQPPSFNRGSSALSAYHEPHRFNVFGNMSGDMPMPEITKEAFGFDDGPLFPRPTSRATQRADSAPPNIRQSTLSHSPHISRPSWASIDNVNKGTSPSKDKQREAEPNMGGAANVILPFEEDTVPGPSAQSSFQPQVPLDATFTVGFSTSPASLELRSQRGDSTSSSSTSSSTVSKFSMIEHGIIDLSTAPTSAIPPTFDKNEAIGKSETSLGKAKDATVATSKTATPLQPSSNTGTLTKGVQVDSSRSASPFPFPAQASSAQVHPSTPARKTSDPPETVPKKEAPIPVSQKGQTPGNVVAPKAQVSTPAAGPSTQSAAPRPPVEFSTLVDVLRKQHPKILSKTTLGSLLVQQDANVYKKAKFSKFGSYIAAAVKAGIITEHVNSRGEQCVVLRPPYAP
ncbi:hypothetical protein CPC08DRAFT_817282 [Agrocybe pediades]|nr:hypothetical protein CPC08DRAFT_817282 [Agrocybe pediades]